VNRLKNKAAIITGGGGFLGSAMAGIFAEEGAAISLWDIDSGLDGARKVEQEILKRGGRAIAQGVDVTASQQVNRGALQAIEEFGKVDILINNAGIVKSAPLITDLSDEDWTKEISVDLTGSFYCSRALLPHMMERRSGKIVNIASMAGELGRPITSAGYSSAKAGLLGFTMSVAMSVAKYGICVNAVCPGIILGPIHYRSYSKEQLPRLLDGIPLVESGRNGTAQDVSYAALFLASSESDYITGTRIRVNGGSLMG